jgi:Rrf2 family iron-sulfur cluster assembly transcriptional regulator
MRLGSKGRYAVTALVDLAAHSGDRPAPLSDIAARHNLSLQYLEQIFVRLRRAGLVESARGPGGGYRLAMLAADIRLTDILTAAGEIVRTTGCAEGSPKACTGATGRCLTHHLWEDLGRHISTYFDETSLADVIDRRVGARRRTPAEKAEAVL